MPVRVHCTLGIGGRLAGPPAENGPILAKLQQLLPKEAPTKMGGGWPAGLISQDWQVSSWDSAAEVGGENDRETRFTFRLELSSRLDGTIYDCRNELSYTHFHWFSHYRDNVWHKDLKVRLEALNHEIIERYGADRLVEKIWFREWQFWCGNGGDH